MSTTLEDILDLTKEEYAQKAAWALREIREETGLSQRFFLKLLEVDDELSEPQYANYENGAAKRGPTLWFAGHVLHSEALVPVFAKRPELRTMLMGLYLRGVA